jgi:hypothetical protein
LNPADGKKQGEGEGVKSSQDSCCFLARSLAFSPRFAPPAAQIRKPFILFLDSRREISTKKEV